VIEGGNQPSFCFEEKAYLNFSSNDYLGLASSDELAKAWQEGIQRYGVGSGASPLVTGFSTAHNQLEQALCQWLGFDKAVLFNSGFSANQAVLFTLLEKNDLLIQDKLNHASLMEAGILSAASMKRFKHNDVAHLSSLLAGDRQNFVVTEGIFSMDGDRAPLTQIARITQENNGWLMIDDAHGMGVLGRNGGGSCEAAKVKPQLLVATFGKAFGLSGAAVLCDANTADYLTQFARHHVYSTAMPPSQAHALTHAAGMLQNQHWRREKLLELSDVYRETLSSSAGYVDTETPIKPYICGNLDNTVALANRLKNEGYWVTAIRPPTVAKGSCRIRITLTTNHTPQQVKQLATHIAQFS
jgi:8-amino-7-oxononanoate synthase